MRKLLTLILLLCTVTLFAEMRGGAQYDPGAARSNLSNVDAAATPSMTSITLSDKVRAAWADILGDIYASGTVKVSTGTAAASAYSFASDPNTGMYSLGAGSIGFSVNNAFLARLKSTGLSFSAVDAGRIQLKRGDFIGFANASDNANSEYIFANSGNLELGVSGQTRQVITSSGEVLIATSTDAGDYKLQVNGNVYVTNDVSALSFTDRTPAPESLAESYAIIQSHEVKNKMLDHSKLHSAAWGTKTRVSTTGRMMKRKLDDGKEVIEPETEIVSEPDPDGRNLSITITAQALVIKDLIKRIEALEKNK